MKRKIVVLSIIIMALFLGACATANIDTPEKKYLVARSELNLLLEQYIGIQDKFKPADQKTIKEAFYTSKMALDVWEINISTIGYDFTTDYKTWLAAKSLILQTIREAYSE